MNCNGMAGRAKGFSTSIFFVGIMLVSRHGSAYAGPVARPSLTPNMTRILSALAALALTGPLAAAEPIKVLILDGQNNHNWRATTPILKKVLEDAKVFAVDVATAPDKPRPPQKPKDLTTDAAQGAFAEAQAKFQAAATQYQREMAAF